MNKQGMEMDKLVKTAVYLAALISLDGCVTPATLGANGYALEDARLVCEVAVDGRCIAWASVCPVPVAALGRR